MKPVQQVFELVLDDIDCFQSGKEEFHKMVESVMETVGEDAEKREKKLVDLRNRQVKILLFDKFLNEQTKPLRGQAKKTVEKKPSEKKPRARKMRILKEEKDGSISDLGSIVKGEAKVDGGAKVEGEAKGEGEAKVEGGAKVEGEAIKKPRGRPRKIKIIQEPTEEIPKAVPVPDSAKSNISDITMPDISVEPVKRPRGRPRKIKLIVEE